MTQGNLLSPTIFNVVGDTVIRHWESLLVAEQEGDKISSDEGDGTQMAGGTIRYQDDRKKWAEKGHQRLTAKSAFFNADHGVVASTDPGWLQSAFDLLTGLFDQVGLRTNISKTVGMVCQPCRVAGVRSDKSYTRMMTREGVSFKERKWERVSCPECGKELEKRSLVTHRQNHHGVAKWRLGLEGDEADGGGDKPRTYRMAFPTRAGPRPCTVKGCSGRASTWTAM